jgi:hypothetical protein
MDLEGQVERDTGGKPMRRPDWLKDVTDAMGRKFNPKLHGKEAQLDNAGFLKVPRRDAPKPMNPGAILDDTLRLHKTEGYAYYFANAKPGRLERMQAHDWEVVQGSDGPVQLKLTARETGAEHTVLMRKPVEWYEEDQRAKEERAIHALDEKPNIGAGKLASGYGSGAQADSGLR